MEREPDFVRDVAVIALGIFFGVLLCAIAARAYLAIEAQQAMAAVQSAIDSSRQAQREVDAAQLERNRQAEQSRRSQLAVQAQETQRQADQLKQSYELQGAKEAAWSAYYRSAPKCTDPTQNDVMVECGNAHIRARRDFELSWAKDHP